MNINIKDIKFLLSLSPKDRAIDVPQGLCPTLYITASYRGDVEIAQRLEAIRMLVEESNDE